MDKKRLGNISIFLIILIPILFTIANFLLNRFYTDIPSGDSIIEDISLRPGVSIPMLLGIFSGVLSFITGLMAIIKNKGVFILVYISTLIGGLMTLFAVLQFII